MQHLPPDARPREKLLAKGPSALADAELLALLLRTGYAGTPVLTLAQQLLDRFGGVAGLLNVGAESGEPNHSGGKNNSTSGDMALRQVKGLGPAKRAELLAVIELAKRALAQSLQAKPVLSDFASCMNYVRLQLGGQSVEVFGALYLNGLNELIAFEPLFRGTLNQSQVYPREVLRRALALNAAGIVLAHNHPSGSLQPSNTDIAITQQIKVAAQYLDLHVIDHIVVGPSGAVSMAELGLM